MKRTGWTVMLVAMAVAGMAQVFVANDSVITGFQNNDMVFYSFASGSKYTAPVNNWHLAITVRPTQFPNSPLGGTTIRINEAMGVKAIYVPNSKASDFATLDTTGFAMWENLHDSDTALDFGALNTNKNDANVFDFGWGVYNSVSHNVVGDSLYLIKLPNGAIKKLWVEKLIYDTAFQIQYSNLDNSDNQSLFISKKQYPGKNFVYLNMMNHQVLDLEPASSVWDVVFLKYAAADVNPSRYVSTLGVWSNTGTTVAEVRGADAFNNNYFNRTFSSNLNAIGWDWKYYKYQTNLSFKEESSTEVEDAYGIEDSLAYYVNTRSGMVYKLAFTSYSGSNTGKVKFYAESMNATTGIADELTDTSPLHIYPNPATSVINFTLPAAQNCTLRVFNLQGAVVAEAETSSQEYQLDISSFAPGIYAVQCIKGAETSFGKFVVGR